MGQNSNIEWTHHTFNPWRGCTKVSAGCAHCYADTLSKRNPGTLGVWGPNGSRVVAAESYWRQPLKWDRDAAAAGERHRVFCASLADVFEGPETMPTDALPAVRAARVRLFDLIRQTPHLDWLLLTKRPENFREVIRESLLMICSDDEGGVAWSDDLIVWLNDWTGGNAPPNVWLGTSVEDQAAADERIPHLLRCPAAVRFLSCEPLLGAVDLQRVADPDPRARKLGVTFSALSIKRGIGLGTPLTPTDGDDDYCLNAVDWIIVGGESGPHARPMHVEHARSIVGQCQAAGVPVFAKQLGSVPEVSDFEAAGLSRQWAADGLAGRQYTGRGNGRLVLHLKDRHGGDPAEWPADLRVRQFPTPATAEVHP